MKRIQIDRAHLDLLLTRLPRDHGYDPLKNATCMNSSRAGGVANDWVIYCDSEQAQKILGLAKQWCPEAVSTIERGINGFAVG
jgi:hypothetical protein